MCIWLLLCGSMFSFENKQKCPLGKMRMLWLGFVAPFISICHKKRPESFKTLISCNFSLRVLYPESAFLRLSQLWSQRPGCHFCGSICFVQFVLSEMGQVGPMWSVVSVFILMSHQTDSWATVFTLLRAESQSSLIILKTYRKIKEFVGLGVTWKEYA